MNRLIHYIKSYKRRKWFSLFYGFGLSIPTVKHRREFEHMEMGYGAMSETDVVNHYARRNQNKSPTKIGDNTGKNIYPCKVYDKDMNLVRVIGVDEVQKSLDASYNKSTWRARGIEYRNKHGNSGNREEEK